MCVASVLDLVGVLEVLENVTKLPLEVVEEGWVVGTDLDAK